MNWPHDDIMRRASLRSERRLAFLESRLRWQRRVAALLILLCGISAGMAVTGWLLYG